MHEEQINDQHWESVEEAVELIAEGNAQGAVERLTGVLDQEPENPYAYQFMGAAYYELKQWPQALKAYLRALELAPAYLGAMVGAGHALREMQQLDRAIRMGKQVLLRERDDADGHYLLGVAHYQRGDREAARKHLSAFLETGPQVEMMIEVQGLIQALDKESPPTP